MELRARRHTGLWHCTQPRHYTFSKAMCWVAAYRGSELAEFSACPARARGWCVGEPEKADRPRACLQQGQRLFSQAFDATRPTLLEPALPALGLIDPLDPRFTSTVRAYEKARTRGPDDALRASRHFGHATSAFSICRSGGSKRRDDGRSR
jgi:hypothetical protein